MIDDSHETNSSSAFLSMVLVAFGYLNSGYNFGQK